MCLKLSQQRDNARTGIDQGENILVPCSTLSDVFLVPLNNASDIRCAAYQKGFSAVIGFKLGERPLCDA